MTLCVSLSLVSCFNVPEPPRPTITSEVDDWRDEVIYQVLVDRFDNGDKNNDYNLNVEAPTGWHGGDWQGVIDRLDYLQELGVTTLWISPAVKNVEQDAGVAGYHGYWTQHFQATNPHFGDMQRLRKLVDEAHKRDMKIILDIVTNHIGQLFYYDINLNKNPDINTQGSGYCYEPENMTSDTSGFACDGRTESRLIRVTEWDPDYDPRGVQAYTSLGEAGPAPVRWVYYPEDNRVPPMPEEFQNEEWYNRRGRVVTPWGWGITEQVERADFPGGLKDIDTTRPEVRAKLIEVFSWWVEQTNLDGFRIDTVKHIQVFDDVFKRNQPTKKIEDLFLARAVNYGNTGQVGGVTDVNGNGLAPTQVLVNFMDNHDVSRFLYDFNDLPALHNALFYLLTMDGIPCIYYGTEQAYNGGNDPANREDMWRVPFNDYYVLYDANGDVVPRDKRDEAFVPFNTAHPTFNHIKRLTGLRKELKSLRRGDFDVKWSGTRTAQEQDAGIFAFERSYDGETTLVVLNVNPTEESETSATSLGGGNMKVDFAPGTVLTDRFADTPYEVTVDSNQEVLVKVPARGGRILTIK
jgi:alpha-amylase